MKTKVHIGTVSHGTARTEDLLPAFADELEGLSTKKEHKKLIKEAREWIDAIDEDEESDQTCDMNRQELGSELVDELMCALDECAPPYMYFGNLEGDGSDFGFWVDSQALDVAEQEKEILKVDDLNEVPRGHNGDVLQVNDHGNMTLYHATRGKLKEIWSVV